MHTNWCVLIEISMEIGMLNFWLGLLVTALTKETYFMKEGKLAILPKSSPNLKSQSPTAGFLYNDFDDRKGKRPLQTPLGLYPKIWRTWTQWDDIISEGVTAQWANKDFVLKKFGPKPENIFYITKTYLRTSKLPRNKIEVWLPNMFWVKAGLL